jgi:hypothetical protein
MRLNKYIIIIVLIGSTLNGCIDPYDPGDLEFESMLFIEARITDDPDVTPYVSFKQVYPLSDHYIWDETVVNTSGATIYIENTLGEKWYFNEKFNPWPGSMPSYYYYLTDTNFKLQKGESYRIYIETTDGYIFESQYEKYLASPPVEDIIYNYDIWETNETGESTDGYRFYISSRSEGEDPLYLRWLLDATYCYRVPYKATHYWTGNTMIDSTNQGLRVCYMDEYIDGIFTGTSEGLAINRIANAPLHGVSRYGDRLQIEYSLHVKQIRIPSSAYRFWNDLKSLLYETGGLYETIPFRLTGNISCVSHEDISVAGLFEVTGVSETRIFVPRPDDFRIVTDRCIPDTLSFSDFQWRNLPAGTWIMEVEPGVYVIAPVTCFDCTAKGGYTQEPPFWEK